MMLLIWIILMCVGFDPISSFLISFLATAVLGAMEDDDKPQIVNNYYGGDYDDTDNSDG